jgi:hypothetical protein
MAVEAKCLPAQLAFDAVDAVAVEPKAKGVFNIVDDEPAPVSKSVAYTAECGGAKPPRRVPG